MTQKLDYQTQILQNGIGQDMQIKHTQKVDHIMETNQEMAKQNQAGKDMKLAARIPLAVIHAWEQEGLQMHLVGSDPEMTARFWKKLQSPEYAKLRIWNGRMV